ncbi:hypothetical protein B0H15DRAFT_974187 [Mycena belliarum]|uniref:Uncharacterized protein n=1 Tax=Mycena belliarum TaxID=1033014 RepID=A0AAD6U767_9AGAR|nr:hypothetical protein B0H15DRAFT_974187 [Mycena belliae]
MAQASAIASLALGSGPGQTVAYLTNEFSGPGLQPAAGKAQDVLSILEKYEDLLTDAERTEIVDIFCKSFSLKQSIVNAEAEHKSRNAFQKLVGYSKGRKAAGKILQQAGAGNERAINISEKATLRAIHSRLPPASSSQCKSRRILSPRRHRVDCLNDNATISCAYDNQDGFERTILPALFTFLHS